MANSRTSWILELVDKVTAPLKTITSNVTGAERSTAMMTAQVERLRKQSGNLQGTLLKLGAGVVSFGLLAQGSLQFEEGMARANTMAQLGSKGFEKLTNDIRGVADVIPIARDQITDGLYSAISAGVPDNNIISFIEDSSKAAIGANAELNTVIDTTATVVKAYGDSWDNAAKIQDKFAKTVQLGQLPSLDALANALPQVTSLASSLNVSQEELLGTFAAASGVMGSASEVGTQLNAVLSAMIKPTSEAAKMAKQLGVAFDANSIEKAGGLKNYIDELMPRIDAFSKQSGKTSQEIIGNLFGSQEAIKLVIGLGGELAEDWQSATAQIGNSTGTVQTQFDIMSGTTNMKMQILKNQFANTMDGIVDAVAPVLNVLLIVTSAVFGFFKTFMDNNPVLSKAIIMAGVLTFGIIAVITAMRLLVVQTKLAAKENWNFIKSTVVKILNFVKETIRLATVISLYAAYYTGLAIATAAQWLFNIALSANPIGLVVLGIAALIAIIAVAVTYWDEITGAVMRFGSWLVNLVDSIFPGFKEGIKNAFKAAYDWVMSFWEGIKGVFNSIGKFLGLVSDTDATIQVQTEGMDEFDLAQQMEVEANRQNDKSGVNAPLQDLFFKPTNTGDNKNNSGVNLPNATGSATAGGSGKTVTINFDLKNTFNVSGDGDFSRNMDKYIDVFIGKINDQLKDAVIATT